MEKSDAFALRAGARHLVNQLDSGLTAPRQHSVEIVDGEADVMDSRSPLRHESRDRGVSLHRFQQFDK